MTLDRASSLALLCIILGLFVRARVRPQQFARVDQEGQSALLGRGAMTALYAAVAPLGRLCQRAGLSANAISALSLLLSAAAGAAFALGQLGVGALLGAIACGCDALDGFVARATGTASDAGEVLDAALDRYVELCLFAGLGLYFREQPAGLLSVFAALAGSFMVSYSSAKAEALAITAPRGSMRRVERMCVLIAGAGLTPFSAGLGLYADAPISVALIFLAVFANASAIGRLSHVARALRERDEQRSESLHDPCVDP